jgi:hypothetical protein
MRPWLSRSLLIAVTFALCWGGAVWYWRETNRMPTSGELAIYLLLVPLGLLLSFWFAKKLIAALTAAPAVAALAQDPAQDKPDATPAQPGAPLRIVAAALRMPHGDSAPELAEAMLSEQARLELDPELSDDNGYPVMSGRVAGVDETAQADAMADWLQQSGLAELRFDAEQWRALSLGSSVLGELAQAVLMHQVLPQYLAASPAERVALDLPMLQLVALLPAEWDGARRQAAASWFLHLIEQQGWPAERLALSGAAVAHAIAPFALIGQLAGQAEREDRSCLAIVLSCASHIGELSVQDWAERGILFTARNPGGRIPGEGAAGLLLADSRQALLLDAPDAVQLHAASAAMRGASADGKGRTDTELLAGLGQQALRTGAADASLVSFLSADTDHRSSRVTELMSMANAMLPQLDLSTQVLSVAASCGDAGTVSALAALVLAQQDAVDNASHVLCVSNLDPYQRSAVLVGPASAPAASA